MRVEWLPLQVKHPTWDLYGGTHYLQPSFAGVRASMAAGPDLRRLCQRHFSWSRDMELHEGVGVDHGEERRGSSDQGEERRGSSSSSSLEIVGPVRRNVAVAAKAIQTLESSRVAGGKLDGCLGAPISALLATALGGCGDGVSGVFEAEDGARSDPIEMSELVQGTIVHSDASGGPLSQEQGGPLRVTFPEGVAVQDSMCGTAKPVNLKFVVKLTLSSAKALPPSAEAVGTDKKAGAQAVNEGVLAEEPWPWVWAQKPSIGSVVVVVGSGAAAAAALQQVCASRDPLLTTVIAIGDEQQLLRHGVGRGGTEKTGIIDAAVHSVDYEAKILLTTPRHAIGTRRALSDWHPEERLIFFDEMLVT